mmetsp:Transcript_40267/g.46093  ORF Transcript_40267/g.46093 Transcript_40267/m.46093 type:complete len:249 (+) Transcript_40267:455-1201(+)
MFAWEVPLWPHPRTDRFIRDIFVLLGSIVMKEVSKKLLVRLVLIMSLKVVPERPPVKPVRRTSLHPRRRPPSVHSVVPLQRLVRIEPLVSVRAPTDSTRNRISPVDAVPDSSTMTMSSETEILIVIYLALKRCIPDVLMMRSEMLSEIASVVTAVPRIVFLVKVPEVSLMVSVSVKVSKVWKKFVGPIVEVMPIRSGCYPVVKSNSTREMMPLWLRATKIVTFQRFMGTPSSVPLVVVPPSVLLYPSE